MVGQDSVAEEQPSRLSTAVDKGSQLAAALVGGAVGLVGGPAGAIGGAAAGWAAGEALPRIASEVIARVGERGAARAGAALVLVEADSAERAERGEHPRDDGFFNPHKGKRPDADELLEAVLRQAAETYEERKLPYLAWLYSAVAHEPDVSAPDALYLVRLAGELTYRQFVAVAVFANHDEHMRKLARASSLHDEGRAEPDEAILLEVSDLVDRRLLGVGGSGRVVPLSNVFEGLLPRDKTGYGQLRLLPGGDRLARLTGLDGLGADEREAWVTALTGSATP